MNKDIHSIVLNGGASIIKEGVSGKGVRNLKLR
jgi:hypothetical protein